MPGIFSETSSFSNKFDAALQNASFRFVYLSMQDGIMQTHDEETRRFFKHSSVQVLLCPRVAGKRHSWIKQRVGFFIYISFISSSLL